MYSPVHFPLSLSYKMLCRLLLAIVLLLNFVNSEFLELNEEENENETTKRTGKFFGIFGFISGKKKIFFFKKNLKN